MKPGHPFEDLVRDTHRLIDEMKRNQTTPAENYFHGDCTPVLRKYGHRSAGEFAAHLLSASMKKAWFQE